MLDLSVGYKLDNALILTCSWCFRCAIVAQISAVIMPVATENHKCNVTKVTVIIITITAFMILVENAGLSFPKRVGNIEGKNAN